jgi:hypothetical protein
MPFSSTPVYVGLGDQVEVRYPTPSTWNTKVSVDVQIGTGSDPDGIIFGTRIPDSRPDSFSFNDQQAFINTSTTTVLTTIERSTTYYSNEILVNGIEIEIPAVITVATSGPKGTTTGANAAAAFRIDRGGSIGPWITSGTVRQGDKIRLRLTTENWYTTTTNVTLRLSDETWGTNVGQPSAVVSDTWSVTTRAQDQLVNSWQFTDFVDVIATEFSGYKTQNIPITGIDADVVLRATSTGNVQISKDNSTWSQSVTGLVLNNTLYTRIAIGSTYTTKTSGSVTIFSNDADTLAGGYENNDAGTYGSGTFQVVQSTGTRTDSWYLWTEVDRYPNTVSLSPIFTPSDDDNITGLIDNVVVSSTNTFNAADPSRTYFTNFSISGLGTEYSSNTYAEAALPINPSYLSGLLPLNTTPTSNQTVQVLCSVTSGDAEIRKNNTGTWVQQLYVQNGDQVNLRFTASPNFNTTKTSSIRISGPPSAGPDGNPTAGPTSPTFADKVDTITLKTRLSRSNPYPFRARDNYNALPGQTYISTIPISGLDVDTIAQAVDAQSTAGANVQVSVDNVTFAKSITVPASATVVYVRATASNTQGNVVSAAYRIGTSTDVWKIQTQIEDNIYATYSGGVGADGTFIEYNLPGYVEQLNFVLYGGGGGNGGDDAPNSFGGRGGFSTILKGVINLPQEVLDDENLRNLKIYSGNAGRFGVNFLEGAVGGAGGWGYAIGGDGGNAGPSDKSGGGGGGGGASAITLGDGTLLVLAGGGGGGAGAGNDTTLQQTNQNGNYTGVTTLRTSLNGLNFNGSDGQSNLTVGGGGGGGGGGFGLGGIIPPNKVDESGVIIQTTDLDANGGTTGDLYYNSNYATITETTGLNLGAGPQQFGFVLLTYAPQDITPEPFFFPEVDNASPATQYTSEKIQIFGITGGVISTLIGNSAQVRTCNPNDPDTCGTWGQSAIIFNEGYVQVRFTTGNDFFTTYRANVTIGNVTSFFNVNTGEPPDNNPAPFTIPNKIDQAVNTLIESDIVYVSGINVPVNITATNGAQISICTPSGACDTYQNSPRQISNGQGFKVRLLSSVDNLTSVFTDVAVGTGSSVEWEVRTIKAFDITPIGFIFTDLNNQLLNTLVNSNTRTIQGIDTSIVATVTGGASVIINADTDNPILPVGNTTTFTISNLDSIQLRYTTSGITGEAKEFVVTVGSYSTTWTVTNEGQLGTSPTPFLFTPVLATGPGIFTDSEIITITGLGQTVSIFSTGSGLISINGGSFQALTISNPGTVSNGSTIRVRLRSSDIEAFSVTTNVYVGSYNTPFSVTTPGPAPEPVFGQYYSSPYVIKVLGADQIKFNTKFDGMAVGAIMPVFKDNTQEDDWGISDDKLNGKANSRFPGWIYCDGRFVSPDDYPLLYDVIGNTFGANLAGEFRVPDMRNRKLLGTGNVDNQSPASPIVTPEYGPAKQRGNGSAFIPGSFGGMWYIDTIADPGIDELEQVETPATGQPAQDSQFFAIAQIRTTGYQEVSDSIEFLTSGQVSGQVSLKETKLFDAPFHQHNLITGQADLGSFKGRVGWGSPGGAALRANIGQKTGSSATPPLEGTVSINLWGYHTGNNYQLLSDPSNSDETADTIRTSNSIAEYGSVWGRDIGEYGQCRPPGKSGNFLDPNEDPGPGSEGLECLFGFLSVNCGSPRVARSWTSIRINQPNSALFGEIYNYVEPNALPADTTSGNNLRWIGAITIPRRFVAVSKFSPSEKLTHSHYVSLTAITDTTNVFSYGNSTGGGTSFGGAPATSSVSVVFTAAQVGLEVFPGTFTLGQGKQLIPTPAFSPNDLVPLVTPYTKVRWMIKAY